MKCTTRLAALLACLAFVALAGPARSASSGYVQTNLVSDGAVPANLIDPTLRNPWGVAFFPGLSPFWVNDNNAGLSALYDGAGVPFALLPHVTIPAPTSPTGGTPTGIVANFFALSGAFPIASSVPPGPALFIFDTEDGTIEAWNLALPDPDVPIPDDAVIIKDNSAGGGPTGAVYKGLALGTNSAGQPFLYATNFRSGKIDVFDAGFNSATLSGSFTDPKLQQGYAPFGIQNIGGKLFVTYALQDAAKHDPVNKPGHGFVDVFDTDGNFLQRFAQHGHLDSPWGVALAPPTFGQFADDILVGNFGNGSINAFDPASGHWLGRVSGPDGRPLINDGLWSLTFGGAINSSPNTLYFTAGLNHEQDGLFGTIVPQ